MARPYRTKFQGRKKIEKNNSSLSDLIPKPNFTQRTVNRDTVVSAFAAWRRKQGTGLISVSADTPCYSIRVRLEKAVLFHPRYFHTHVWSQLDVPSVWSLANTWQFTELQHTETNNRSQSHSGLYLGVAVSDFSGAVRLFTSPDQELVRPQL